MSIRSKILEMVVFSALKWCVVILFLGVIGYLIMPKYDYVNGKAFNRVTGHFDEKKDLEERF